MNMDIQLYKYAMKYCYPDTKSTFVYIEITITNAA